ncbi:MAG: flagellar basal body rod protein FlgB [Lachnospiraceae bacterium]|nr:flagellar basal body rod protein FlgB [Lachnospiraceae bacterium]
MINTGVFDYINVLEKAADGAWKRNEVIANNIANIDTPDYKRQDISFQAELQHALKASKYTSLDTKVRDLNDRNRLSHIEPRQYTDYANYSYRLDGNNVDVDNENVELASNQIVYQAIVQSINSEFTEIKTAIGK